MATRGRKPKQTAMKELEVKVLSVLTENIKIFGIRKYLRFSRFVCLLQDSIIDQNGDYLRHGIIRHFKSRGGFLNINDRIVFQIGKHFKNAGTLPLCESIE